MENKRPFSVLFSFIYKNNLQTSFGLLFLFAAVQKVLNFNIQWDLCFLLAFAVPPIYVADHWFDNRNSSNKAKFSFLFWIVPLVGILGSVSILLTLSSEIKLRFSIPFIAAAIYFLVYVLAWSKIKNESIKYVLSAVKNGLIAAVFFLILVYVPGCLNKASFYILPLLFLVLFQNLLVFSLLDAKEDGLSNKANGFNVTFFKKNSKTIGLITFLGVGFLASFNDIYTSVNPYFVLGLFMVSVFYLTILFLEETGNKIVVRFFADLTLALPALSLLF